MKTKTINKNLFEPTKAETKQAINQYKKIEKKAHELSILLNNFLSQPATIKVGIKGNCFFDSYQKGNVLTAEFKGKISIK